MNKKWSEKTTFEKVVDIISGIALCIWLIFEVLERKKIVSYANFVSCCAILVVCICQAISYWNVKRAFSYVAIGGTVLLAATLILTVLWLYDCIFRSENVWNGDGWDPDSSTNCTLFGSEFYTGDDAVAIKSGKNPEGNIINKPCEHIRVFDCVSHFGHGITIGSEMSGGVSDVKVWNCDMRNSVYGVEIKGTKKRGGYVRDVHVSYSTVCRVLMHSVGYNDDGEGAPTAPVFENCTFENMTITAKMYNKKNEDVYCEAIELSGFDIPGHFVKNIKFKDIKIDNGIDSRRQAIYLQCCEGITFENIYCR